MNWTDSKWLVLIFIVYGVNVARTISRYQLCRLKAKYDYICAIKQAAADYDTANADEISDHLLDKDTAQFWISRNSKYYKSFGVCY